MLFSRPFGTCAIQIRHPGVETRAIVGKSLRDNAHRANRGLPKGPGQRVCNLLPDFL
jgi:hypothetical protein